MAMPAKSASGKPLGASGVFHSCDCCDDDPCDTCCAGVWNFANCSTAGPFSVTIIESYDSCTTTSNLSVAWDSGNNRFDGLDNSQFRFRVQITCVSGVWNLKAFSQTGIIVLYRTPIGPGCDVVGSYTFTSTQPSNPGCGSPTGITCVVS